MTKDVHMDGMIICSMKILLRADMVGCDYCCYSLWIMLFEIKGNQEIRSMLTSHTLRLRFNGIGFILCVLM
uniref:Uncharacterized protein n=1 Tax=Rhizophora mucronata TaxID=61149 RepID=A0A2P2KU86_RHIMU